MRRTSRALQIGGLEACMPGDSCHHARPYFFTIVERKNVVRPIGSHQRFVRTAGLPFDRPTDFQQGGKQTGGLN